MRHLGQWPKGAPELMSDPQLLHVPVEFTPVNFPIFLKLPGRVVTAFLGPVRASKAGEQIAQLPVGLSGISDRGEDLISKNLAEATAHSHRRHSCRRLSKG